MLRPICLPFGSMKPRRFSSPMMAARVADAPMPSPSRRSFFSSGSVTNL